MKESKKYNFRINYVFFMLLFIVIGSYLAGTFISQYKLKKLTTGLQADFDKQQAKLYEISKNIDSGKGSEIAGFVINDCTKSERDRFEKLLGNLNNELPVSDLLELDRLFGRCANFLPVRDLVSSMVFVQEVNNYEKIIKYLNTFHKKSDYHKLGTWRELSDLEMKKSKLLQDLTKQQGVIIRLLLSGEKKNSPKIKSVLEKVDQIKSEILITKNKIKILQMKLLNAYS